MATYARDPDPDVEDAHAEYVRVFGKPERGLRGIDCRKALRDYAEVLRSNSEHNPTKVATNENPQSGWMIQCLDEDSGYWIDYQWTADPKEERSMIRHLSRHGNKTRSVIKSEPAPSE